MLERCRGYSSLEIASLHGQPRLQQLLVGVIAGAKEPKVNEAFTVLYEDFLPLRLGGDLIFRILDEKIRTAVAAKAKAASLMGESMVSRDGLGDEPVDASAIAAAKALFELLDADGSGKLSRDEVLGTCFLEQLQQYYGVAELDQLFDGEGKRSELSFEQFVRLAQTIGALPHAESLRLELLRNRDAGQSGSERGSQRTRHSQRYDEMLATFAEWTRGGREASLLSAVENTRLRAVLGGCFAGARNRAVVHALKILYEDHAPLRIGGDLIFGLMSRVVSSTKV